SSHYRGWSIDGGGSVFGSAQRLTRTCQQGGDEGRPSGRSRTVRGTRGDQTTYPTYTRGVTMIRVLLVEDIYTARSGLAMLLAREAGIVIVGHLDVEDSVVPLAVQCRPAVMLINTGYMVSQLLPVVSELRVRIPGCAFLILSDPQRRGMLPPRRRGQELSF